MVGTDLPRPLRYPAEPYHGLLSIVFTAANRSVLFSLNGYITMENQTPLTIEQQYFNICDRISYYQTTCQTLSQSARKVIKDNIQSDIDAIEDKYIRQSAQLKFDRLI